MLCIPKNCAEKKLPLNYPINSLCSSRCVSCRLVSRVCHPFTFHLIQPRNHVSTLFPANLLFLFIPSVPLYLNCWNLAASVHLLLPGFPHMAPWFLIILDLSNESSCLWQQIIQQVAVPLREAMVDQARKRRQSLQRLWRA